jgi:hypothetical protein
MRRLITILLATIAAIALPFTTQTPVQAAEHDYPMQVKVLRTHWHSQRGYFSGFGRGNLISQQAGKPPEQAMDWTFGCGAPVRITMGPDTYPARYGSNELQVIVNLPEMGTTKTKECTLKVEMHDFVYRIRPGNRLVTVPLSGGPDTPVQEDPNANQ